jgi:hypothetical protein
MLGIYNVMLKVDSGMDFRSERPSPDKFMASPYQIVENSQNSRDDMSDRFDVGTSSSYILS